MNPEELPTITSDDAFRLMANPYRRRLLMTLMTHNPEDEADIPAALSTDSEDLKEMLVEMSHVHLPKLDSMGIIEWDREHNVVKRGPMFEDLRPLLELVDKHQDELPDGWL